MILILPMNNNEIKQDIDELERKIEQLRIEYEKFFVGIINVEPTALKNRITQLIRKYATYQIKNVMLNFKFRNLTSRFLIYQEYWNRILRLIEEGKNPRDYRKLAEQFNIKLTSAQQPQEQQQKENDSYKRLYDEYSKLLIQKGKKPPSEEVFRKNLQNYELKVKEKFGEDVTTDFKFENTDKGIKIKTIVKKKR